MKAVGRHLTQNRGELGVEWGVVRKWQTSGGRSQRQTGAGGDHDNGHWSQERQERKSIAHWTQYPLHTEIHIVMEA